jgi:hypothetical protein
MKPDEQALRRLLTAAGRAWPATPGPMPFRLEARILAGWRSSVTADESKLLVTMFRRAVIFGAVIMILSIGWSQMDDGDRVPGAVVIANLEKVIQVVP